MADLVMLDPALIVDAYDITAKMSALALNHGAAMKDGTRSGDRAPRNLAGLTEWDMSHVGVQDFADNQVDERLHGNIGLSGKLISAGADGLSESDIAFFGQATQGEYQAFEDGRIGELVKFTVAASSFSRLARGTVIKDGTAAETATGTGTALQLGAISASQTLYAGVHVLAASGTTPTLDVTIESDNAMGFASPIVRGTFTQFVTTGSLWLTPVVGPITDDWWRAAWSIAGTGPSFTFVVLMAIL